MKIKKSALFVTCLLFLVLTASQCLAIQCYKFTLWEGLTRLSFSSIPNGTEGVKVGSRKILFKGHHKIGICFLRRASPYEAWNEIFQNKQTMRSLFGGGFSGSLSHQFSQQNSAITPSTRLESIDSSTWNSSSPPKRNQKNKENKQPHSKNWKQYPQSNGW